jgi:hypothetical protein
MPNESPEQPVPLPPTWLLILGSGIIAFHLFAIGIRALAAESPWPTPRGDTTPPPKFAEIADRCTSFLYLRPIRMLPEYRIGSNDPKTLGVYLEVVLKDGSGRPFKTIKVPDPEANAWVRHRQWLLARALTTDQIVPPPPPGERVAAPHQKLPTLTIWQPVQQQGPPRLKLEQVSERKIPRDREVQRPSEWSLLLAKSYARYLCRTHGAASAEVIRHTLPPLPPEILEMEMPPPFELISNFGEYSK